MKYRIKYCCPILQLSIEANEDCKFEVFTLSNNWRHTKQILDDDFESIYRCVGSFYIETLSTNTHFITELYVEITNLNEKKTILDYVSFLLYEKIQTLISCLWLIKDNPIFLGTSVLVSKELSYLCTRTFNKYRTDSKGKKEQTVFSYEEVMQAIRYQQKCSLILTNYNLYSRDNSLGLRPQKTTLNELMFSSDSRLDTAYRFLNLAIATEYIPMKIMHYMSTLEALFSIDNINIGKSISYRTCVFLGKRGNDKTRTRTILIRAYDIRSRFVHGNLVSSSVEYIPQVSTEVDSILRSVFIKIFEGDFINFKQEQDAQKAWLRELWNDEPLPK